MNRSVAEIHMELENALYFANKMDKVVQDSNPDDSDSLVFMGCHWDLDDLIELQKESDEDINILYKEFMEALKS